MKLGGRCQRGVRRALWANGIASTSEIMQWAYPLNTGSPKNRSRAVLHAADRMAIRVGRSPTGKGRPVLWRLKDED
jgi:hypothetical protein